MELFDLDISTFVLLAGTIIPLLVGLVAKKVASAGLKSVLNAFLSAVAAAVAVVSESGAFVLEEFLPVAFTTFVVSIATYYGLWKPTGVSETVIDATENFGVTWHSREK